MELTVVSMLTTTPLRMPRDSCWPRPSTSKRPSDRISATTATTLLVPISRATMRSLMSRVMALTLLRRSGWRFRFGLPVGQRRQRQREPVRVAQVGLRDGAAFQAAGHGGPGLNEALDARGKRQRARQAMRIGRI